MEQDNLYGMDPSVVNIQSTSENGTEVATPALRVPLHDEFEITPEGGHRVLQGLRLRSFGIGGMSDKELTDLAAMHNKHSTEVAAVRQRISKPIQE